MDIVIFRKLHSISFGAASSMAAACGLALLTQVLSRTTWVTVVAMSTQPATITVSTVFQSAVSPDSSI